MDAPAQQPVGTRVRIPVPDVQPFLQNIWDTPPDIRHWLLSFKTYLDCVEMDQDAGNFLGDREKKALLMSHLGNEGLQSFAITLEYAALQDPNRQMMYPQLRDHIIALFMDDVVAYLVASEAVAMETKGLSQASHSPG
ncbi:MAG: hypothetical protein GY696_26595 [Gammaproteobacteria bacterium]|nr:hypothetical protein [Gammaproteobacteria bacterium]